MPRNRIIINHDDFVVPGDGGEWLFFSPKTTPTHNNSTEALPSLKLDEDSSNNNKNVIPPNKKKKLIVRFGLNDELLIVSNTTLFCMENFQDSSNGEPGKQQHLFHIDESLHVFDSNAEIAKTFASHNHYFVWKLAKELVINEDYNNGFCRYFI